MNPAARAYGNAQRFRKPTGNTFGVRSTRTTLPAPSKGKEREEKPADPPSYKHADKQQGEKDTEAEGKGSEDDALRAGQGKNPDTTEGPTVTFKQPTHQVKDNEPDTRGSTETAVRASMPFENFWALETGFDLEEVTFEKPNYWTPNALALFETLRASQRFTTDSRIINKHHPEYIEYAVACYYAMIFHIQILRAREAANRLTGEESSFLRRFRRKYPEESLPIAGQMFPVLSSIVSVLLPDPKFNWIVPQTAPDMFNNTTITTISQAVTAHEGGPFLQPHFPMMIAILRESIAVARAQTLTDGSHYTEEEYYVTNTFNDTTAVQIFGNNYRLNQTAAADANGFFNFLGVSYPFNSDAEQLTQASKHWVRSSFNGLGIRATGAGTTDISSLEKFLLMPKSSDGDWFHQIINQATTHARFFKDGRTLSDLPTTGGNEVLVDTILRKNSDTGRIYHDTRHLGLILATGTNPWYPEHLRGLIAGFRTTRSAVQRAQILQALAFGTNAKLNIEINTNRVGSGPNHRSGQYWEDASWNLEKYNDTTDAGNATSQAHGKPMFRGWETMIQEKFVLVKPEGY
ncbi:capsid protein [Hygrophorus penarioides partitivirus 1]|nr:capsid protein [Hygrophorus penarioides partitivirus 1]